MITEIEIKIQISDDDQQTLVAWLGKHANNHGAIHYIEYYINNPRASFIFASKDGYRDAIDFLRIRFTDKGDSVCFKHWHADSETGKLTHCDEYETRVQDGKTLLEVFQAIGFTESVVIDKTRTVYRTDEFEVAVDDVLELGRFVEVELIKDVGDVAEGLSRIYNFLKRLGIRRFRKMDRGYVS